MGWIRIPGASRRAVKNANAGILPRCFSIAIVPARLHSALTMQSAREFVEDLLRKETDFIEAVGVAFPGASFQTRRQVVLKVSELKTRALVVTSGSGKGYRVRYALRRQRTRWSIAAIQRECPVCSLFEATRDCEHCRGRGWRM
jgi:hypothetical protein